MPTTIEFGVIVAMLIAVAETTKEAYRRHKDQNREEQDELASEVRELRKDVQRLGGYNGHEGQIDRVEETLTEVQDEMLEEHEWMRSEIKQINYVTTQVVGQLDGLNDVENFDSSQIDGDYEHDWRSD